MKYKTSELTGEVLDKAVAAVLFGDEAQMTLEVLSSGIGADGFSPSLNWAHGGPIIERHGITVGPAQKFNAPFKFKAFAAGDNQWPVMADTPLVAAMRCFVIAKMGAEVDL